MIESFDLSISPWRYISGVGCVVQFRVTIIVDGLKHTFEKIVPSNDMLSTYDHLFDCAKQELKDAIQKENK